MAEAGAGQGRGQRWHHSLPCWSRASVFPTYLAWADGHGLGLVALAGILSEGCRTTGPQGHRARSWPGAWLDAPGGSGGGSSWLPGKPEPTNTSLLARGGTMTSSAHPPLRPAGGGGSTVCVGPQAMETKGEAAWGWGLGCSSACCGPEQARPGLPRRPAREERRGGWEEGWPGQALKAQNRIKRVVQVELCGASWVCPVAGSGLHADSPKAQSLQRTSCHRPWGQVRPQAAMLWPPLPLSALHAPYT